MLRNSRSPISFSTAANSLAISVSTEASPASSPRSIRTATSSIRLRTFPQASVHDLRSLSCCMIFWAATLSFQKPGAWARVSQLGDLLLLGVEVKETPGGSTLSPRIPSVSAGCRQTWVQIVIVSSTSMVMRSIALERVFPCASFFSETVPPPPRLLWSRKLSASRLGSSNRSTGPKQMPSKCFLTASGGDVLQDDRVDIRASGR